MRKKSIYIILLVLSILLPSNMFAQIKTYQFEQIDSLQKIEKRNIVVFVHTQWCKYCHLMQNTTLKSDSVIKILNKKFYFISLNAEEKRDIVFSNRTFKYKPNGANTGTNNLASQIATVQNKLRYPTLCFLNSFNEIIFQYPQYISEGDLKKILNKIN